MEDHLKDKVAVITGGSRGLGYAIAYELAQRGAAVVLSSRSLEDCQNAAQRIVDAGYRAVGFACDVSKHSDVQNLLQFALNQYHKLDIWINNAGIAGPYGPSLDLSMDKFIRVQQTNIFGTYYGSFIAAKYFLSQKSGKLINILGRGASGPVPYQNAYGSSKVWIKNFTLALAKEYKDSGVDMYSVNPGMVITDLLTRVQVVRGSEQQLKVFPLIIKLLANEADVPAKQIANLAASAPGYRSGAAISVSHPAKMLAATVKYFWMKLTRQSIEMPEVDMTVIEPDCKNP